MFSLPSTLAWDAAKQCKDAFSVLAHPLRLGCKARRRSLMSIRLNFTNLHKGDGVKSKRASHVHTRCCRWWNSSLRNNKGVVPTQPDFTHFSLSPDSSFLFILWSWFEINVKIRYLLLRMTHRKTFLVSTRLWIHAFTPHIRTRGQLQTHLIALPACHVLTWYCA